MLLATSFEVSHSHSFRTNTDMFLPTEFPHHQHILPCWTTRPLSLVIDVKLNRHVDFHMSNGRSGRCASAPYEVTLWIDTELNQEDTTGVRR